MRNSKAAAAALVMVAALIGGALMVGAAAEEVRTDTLAPTDPAYQPGDTIPVHQGEVVEASALCSSGRLLSTTFWHLGVYGPTTERTKFVKLSNDDVNGATTNFMVPFDVEPGNYPLSLQCVSGDGTQYYTLAVAAPDQAAGTPLDLVTSWTFGSAAGVDELWAIEPLANGDIAFVGSTNGNLAGTSAGNSDAWVAVYSADGTRRWAAQFGDTTLDIATEVTQIVGGAHDGDLAIVGITTGDIDGAGPAVAATVVDGFLQVRDSTTGAVEHTESIDGFAPCSLPDGAQTASDVIATAGGGLIVVGTTDTSIVPTGVCEIFQPGPVSVGTRNSGGESQRSVAPHSLTPLGGEDVFALWFDDGLNRVHGEHFGTADDEYWVRADATADDLVLAVETTGAVTGTNLGGGVSADVALVVVDLATYAVSLESQFGGPGEESVTNVEVVGDVVWVVGDSDSSPSVSGTTEWPLRSDVNDTVTPSAMWLTARSLADGSEIMFRSFDSAGGDCGGGVAVDSDNRVWAVGGFGTGLTETSTDMQSAIVLADTTGVLHAEQFGGSDDDYAYDTAFTSDGTFVVAGAEGADCGGATKSFVNVFVRTMTQAPPTTTSTTSTTSTTLAVASPSTTDAATSTSTSTSSTTSTVALSTSTTSTVAAVAAGDPQLPSTGSNMPLLAVLVLLLAAGGIAVIATRRSA